MIYASLIYVRICVIFGAVRAMSWLSVLGQGGLLYARHSRVARVKHSRQTTTDIPDALQRRRRRLSRLRASAQTYFSPFTASSMPWHAHALPYY